MDTKEEKIITQDLDLSDITRDTTDTQLQKEAKEVPTEGLPKENVKDIIPTTDDGPEKEVKNEPDYMGINFGPGQGPNREKCGLENCWSDIFNG